MRTVKHPNIVGLLGHKVENQEFSLALQFCHGSARDLLVKEGGFNDARFGRFLKDVTSALRHLYNKKILHRDIKPDNILYIDRQGENGETFLVSDFGFASQYTSYESKMRDGCGTCVYMHPEILALGCYKGTEFGIYTDIHSLAVTIYEVITKKRPFQFQCQSREWHDRCEAQLTLIKRKPKGTISFDGKKYQKYLASGEHNLEYEILAKRVELLLADMIDVSSKRSKYFVMATLTLSLSVWFTDGKTDELA